MLANIIYNIVFWIYKVATFMQKVSSILPPIHRTPTKMSQISANLEFPTNNGATTSASPLTSGRTAIKSVQSPIEKKGNGLRNDNYKTSVNFGLKHPCHYTDLEAFWIDQDKPRTRSNAKDQKRRFASLYSDEEYENFLLVTEGRLDRLNETEREKFSSFGRSRIDANAGFGFGRGPSRIDGELGGNTGFGSTNETKYSFGAKPRKATGFGSQLKNEQYSFGATPQKLDGFGPSTKGEDLYFGATPKKTFGETKRFRF